MGTLQTDFSIYDKIGFEKPPIGVKFMFFRPQGIEPLSMDKNISFCEMLKEAQQTRTPFYFSKENNESCVGKFLLGMEGMAAFAESGQIGARLQIFQEPRANYAFYQHVPRFDGGTVNYVVFSPVDKLTFEPDVLVITATPSQGEIVMRSMTYSTGELYNSRTTPVMGCAWCFIYPFKSGHVNYILPEMIHGMKGRELFKEEEMLISIPYQWIPIMTQNLQKMKMHLPSHNSKQEYLEEFGQIMKDLVQEAENP
jgi:uncharacterized protein (DUF169 family)